MKHSFQAAILAIAVLPSAAAAQTPAPPTGGVITLSPDQPSRWDTTFHLGWFGGNKSKTGPDWNRWYDAASVDGGAGYYLTPHLKLEFDLAATAEADMHVQQTVSLAGDIYPYYYRSREHSFRTTTVAGALVYQFFENSWFHPFGGIGVAVERETERAGALPAQTFLRDPQTRVVLPELPALDVTTVSARPFGTLGFKAYASEQVFFRMDVRIAASSDRVESLLWRAGVGVDF
jgi:opacity protein-like surface antigen